MIHKALGLRGNQFPCALKWFKDTLQDGPSTSLDTCFAAHAGTQNGVVPALRVSKLRYGTECGIFVGSGADPSQRREATAVTCMSERVEPKAHGLAIRHAPNTFGRNLDFRFQDAARGR